MENLDDAFNRADQEAALLEEILGSTVSSSDSGNKIVSRDSAYRKYLALANVTSHSVEEKLYECERRFQLMKLNAHLQEANDIEEEAPGSVTFAFGQAVGAGVAEYDRTQSLSKAIMAAFLAWNVDLLDQEERSKKSFWHAVWALTVYETFYREETDLQDYEVVKAEATIAVRFPVDSGSHRYHFYVGHIDELLRNKYTSAYRIAENKTTKYATVDPAMYENSNQGLSYTVVMDSMGETEFDVLYKVYSSTEQRWMAFPFVKHSLAKAEWAQTQFIRIDQINTYSALNFFPKQGKGCFSYGRRCPYFGECDWNLIKKYGIKFSELEVAESFEDLELVEPIDYRVDIEDVLATQQQKAQNV